MKYYTPIRFHSLAGGGGGLEGVVYSRHYDGSALYGSYVTPTDPTEVAVANDLMSFAGTNVDQIVKVPRQYSQFYNDSLTNWASSWGGFSFRMRTNYGPNAVLISNGWYGTANNGGNCFEIGINQEGANKIYFKVRQWYYFIGTYPDWDGTIVSSIDVTDNIEHRISIKATPGAGAQQITYTLYVDGVADGSCAITGFPNKVLGGVGTDIGLNFGGRYNIDTTSWDRLYGGELGDVHIVDHLEDPTIIPAKGSIVSDDNTLLLIQCSSAEGVGSIRDTSLAAVNSFVMKQLGPGGINNVGGVDILQLPGDGMLSCNYMPTLQQSIGPVFYFKTTQVPGASNECVVMDCKGSGSRIKVVLNNDGTITGTLVIPYNAGTVTASTSSTTVLNDGNWHRVMVYYKFGGGQPRVYLRVDGAEESWWPFTNTPTDDQKYYGAEISFGGYSYLNGATPASPLEYFVGDIADPCEITSEAEFDAMSSVPTGNQANKFIDFAMHTSSGVSSKTHKHFSGGVKDQGILGADMHGPFVYRGVSDELVTSDVHGGPALAPPYTIITVSDLSDGVLLSNDGGTPEVEVTDSPGSHVNHGSDVAVRRAMEGRLVTIIVADGVNTKIYQGDRDLRRIASGNPGTGSMTLPKLATGGVQDLRVLDYAVEEDQIDRFLSYFKNLYSVNDPFGIWFDNYANWVVNFHSADVNNGILWDSYGVSESGDGWFEFDGAAALRTTNFAAKVPAMHTIEFWMNTTHTGNATIVSTGTSNSAGGFFLAMNYGAANRLTLVGHGVVSDQEITPTTIINDGSDHHIMISFNNYITFRMSLFIDGVYSGFVDLGPSAAGTLETPGELRFAERHATSGASYVGKLGDIMAYPYTKYIQTESFTPPALLSDSRLRPGQMFCLQSYAPDAGPLVSLDDPTITENGYWFENISSSADQFYHLINTSTLMFSTAASGIRDVRGKSQMPFRVQFKLLVSGVTVWIMGQSNTHGALPNYGWDVTLDGTGALQVRAKEDGGTTKTLVHSVTVNNAVFHDIKIYFTNSAATTLAVDVDGTIENLALARPENFCATPLQIGGIDNPINMYLKDMSFEQHWSAGAPVLSTLTDWHLGIEMPLSERTIDDGWPDRSANANALWSGPSNPGPQVYQHTEYGYTLQFRTVNRRYASGQLYTKTAVNLTPPYTIITDALNLHSEDGVEIPMITDQTGGNFEAGVKNVSGGDYEIYLTADGANYVRKTFASYLGLIAIVVNGASSKIYIGSDITVGNAGTGVLMEKPMITRETNTPNGTPGTGLSRFAMYDGLLSDQQIIDLIT